MGHYWEEVSKEKDERNVSRGNESLKGGGRGKHTKASREK